ncbi:hypothetical protein EZV62_013581 [Acer yangbiense]|uniref:HTH La-type RNA-binding domain-containing protein n=1 Tax=Acer yangbiense TaxID=1000413 RepID=A0A5C7HZM7_9ROSI|nr:hypothetical protein EZV62_013581 [Acer yangbiense]
MIISESAVYGGVNAGKRPAWNKPSNGTGAGAVAAEAGLLMGAHLWPTTIGGGSSTKSCSDSLKGLVDGSSSTPPPPVVSQGRSTGRANSVTQKQVSNNGHPNSTTTLNHTAAPTRPRFTSGNAAGAGTSSNPAPPHGVNDHSQHPNSYRNHSSHHHNYAGRDALMQPHGIVQRFMRHPPPPLHGSSTPFIPPSVNPIWYYVAPPPPDALRGVNAVTYFHATQLHCLIVKQIDYYFTKENLVKDIYLRQKMDDEGWVPIKLIAGFNKVKLLTFNIWLILDALRGSMVVEVCGDKIRRRNDWIKWIIASTGQVGV